MPAFDATTVAVVALGLVLGGFVKGTAGFGLPMVGVAVLSSFLQVPVALAIIAFPIVLTNLWQAFHAGNPTALLKRLWPMIACLLLFIWLSAGLVVSLQPKVLYGVLGTVLMLFTLTSHLRPTMSLEPAAQRWVGPLAGCLGGVLGGISTMWGPPMVIYLMALRLDKETFIRAVGLVWLSGSIPLVLAYVDHGILNARTAPLSALACVPTFMGLALGQWLRRRFDQETFRKVLLAAVFLMGLNLIRRALL